MIQPWIVQISLKFGPDFNHVTLDLQQTFKVKGVKTSRSQRDITN